MPLDRGSPQHARFVERAKQGNIDVLFLGDSITAGWAGAGRRVWAEYYAPIRAANFGISGDRTQHVLWRIQNGELENVHPKAVVLMIGTNNAGASSAEAIADGVKAIVTTLRTKLPEAKVLLLAIFPCGAAAEGPQRAKRAKVNQIIAMLDDGKMVKYLDIGAKFLLADGSLPKDVMPDAVHPNEHGYEIWAEAMNPTLEALLGEKIIKQERPPEPVKPAPATRPAAAAKPAAPAPTAWP